MRIHDDADMNTVVDETVSVLKEAGLQIGKADRQIKPEQIIEVEKAIQDLQKRLESKKRMNADREQ
jgi:hypothetical protein